MPKWRGPDWTRFREFLRDVALVLSLLSAVRNLLK